jgi:hypothetical protein
MLKTTLIFAAVIAAAGFVVASLALPVQQLLVVSSDANARLLELATSFSTMTMAGRLPRWTSACRNTTARAMTNPASAATKRLSQHFLRATALSSSGNEQAQKRLMDVILSLIAATATALLLVLVARDNIGMPADMAAKMLSVRRVLSSRRSPSLKWRPDLKS